MEKQKLMDTLISVGNALLTVEVKGNSVLIMADCIRTLNTLLNDIDKESEAKE